MILETAPVTVDMIAGLLAEEVNKLKLHESLHKTVDSKKLWNGTIDASKFRKETKNPSSNYQAERYSYYIPLTYGALRIDFAHYTKEEKFQYISFSYHLASPSYRWQLLFRDRLERETRDHSIQESVRKFRKAIAGKAKSLVAGIEKWYSNSELNPDNFTLGAYYNQPFTGNFASLVGAVGRVRLLSQLHAHKAQKAGLPTHGERINELADEMLRLLTEQRDMHPNYETSHFSETY